MTGVDEMIAGKHLLLFDGDCGICTRCAEICAEIDAHDLFRIAPYQVVPEQELALHGLSYAKCAGALQVISARGRVYGGPFAVNYFLFKFHPWKPIVVLIYAIPIFLLLEIIVYRVIARNRQWISRWLGLSACRVNHL